MASLKLRTVQSRLRVRPHEQAAVEICQTIGSRSMPEFMPFLLLDDLTAIGKTDGFGDHPHRGQETLTYILEGQVVHQDSKGNQGVLNPGDLQAMRAGKGIIHSEIPVNDPVTHRNKGIQIWVALPQKDLEQNPSYKDVASASILVATPSPGVSIKVIAGESFDKKAALLTCAPVWYFDVSLEPGAKVQHALPQDFNAFTHVLEGEPEIARERSKPHETIFLERDGDAVELENPGNTAARLLLLAGDPLLGQEVHRRGPFVSTSDKGIHQAFLDYRMNINGFEGVNKWASMPVDRVISQTRELSRHTANKG